MRVDGILLTFLEVKGKGAVSTLAKWQALRIPSRHFLSWQERCTSSRSILKVFHVIVVKHFELTHAKAEPTKANGDEIPSHTRKSKGKSKSR